MTWIKTSHSIETLGKGGDDDDDDDDDGDDDDDDDDDGRPRRARHVRTCPHPRAPVLRSPRLIQKN